MVGMLVLNESTRSTLERERDRASDHLRGAMQRKANLDLELADLVKSIAQTSTHVADLNATLEAFAQA